MEKNMEHEIETVEISGFKELNLCYYSGDTILSTIYTNYGNLI